jgi:hypothetical protein
MSFIAVQASVMKLARQAIERMSICQLLAANMDKLTAANNNLAAGRAHTGVVEDDYFSSLGESVDNSGLSIVDRAREELKENKRDVRLRSDRSVCEVRATCVEELRRRGIEGDGSGDSPRFDDECEGQ